MKTDGTLFILLTLVAAIGSTSALSGQPRSYAGVYIGQTNDAGSTSPSGFALFVDPQQNALLIGGDRYNNDNGTAFYASCMTDASGNAQSDTNGVTISMTIHPDGSVDFAANADLGSSDYPWSYGMRGNIVSGGPFQSVSGLYSGAAGGGTVEAIVAADGGVYLSPPGHGGGAMGNFLAYSQPVTLASLGHMILTLTLNADATISATSTNSLNGSTSKFSMSLIDAAPVAPPPPFIESVAFSDASLTLKGTNAISGGTCIVLMSTNVLAPLADWTKIATNTIGAGGSVSITLTNAPASHPRNFFILETR